MCFLLAWFLFLFLFLFWTVTEEERLCFCFFFQFFFSFSSAFVVCSSQQLFLFLHRPCFVFFCCFVLSFSCCLSFKEQRRMILLLTPSLFLVFFFLLFLCFLRLFVNLVKQWEDAQENLAVLVTQSRRTKKDEELIVLCRVIVNEINYGYEDFEGEVIYLSYLQPSLSSTTKWTWQQTIILIHENNFTCYSSTNIINLHLHLQQQRKNISSASSSYFLFTISSFHFSKGLEKC